MEGAVPILPPELWTAASLGQPEEVQRLLGGGAAIQEKGGKRESSPLHEAVRGGHIEVIRVLLEHGADVSAKKMSLETPLHEAMRTGEREMVSLLLKHGADVTSRQWRYRTPLHIAAFNGHPLAVELLLEQGSKLSHTYELFERPLWSLKDSFGDTPLHTAAGKGHKVVVKMLLDHGADINATGKPKKTALMKAAYMEQNYMVRLLLKQGADVTSENIMSVEKWIRDTHIRNSPWCQKWKRILTLLRAGLSPAEKTRLDTWTAFAMGQHERLGACSLINTIPPELAKMILDRV